MTKILNGFHLKDYCCYLLRVQRSMRAFCWGFIHKNSEQDLTIFTWFIPYIDFLRNVRLVKVIICRIEIRTTWLPFLFILLSLVLSQSVIIYVWDNDNCGLTKDKCKTKVGPYIYFVLINLQGTSDSKISTNEE